MSASPGSPCLRPEMKRGGTLRPSRCSECSCRYVEVRIHPCRAQASQERTIVGRDSASGWNFRPRGLHQKWERKLLARACPISRRSAHVDLQPERQSDDLIVNSKSDENGKGGMSLACDHHRLTVADRRRFLQELLPAFSCLREGKDFVTTGTCACTPRHWVPSSCFWRRWCRFPSLSTASTVKSIASLLGKVMSWTIFMFLFGRIFVGLILGSIHMFSKLKHKHVHNCLFVCCSTSVQCLG